MNLIKTSLLLGLIIGAPISGAMAGDVRHLRLELSLGGAYSETEDMLRNVAAFGLGDEDVTASRLAGQLLLGTDLTSRITLGVLLYGLGTTTAEAQGTEWIRTGATGDSVSSQIDVEPEYSRAGVMLYGRVRLAGNRAFGSSFGVGAAAGKEYHRLRLTAVRNLYPAPVTGFAFEEWSQDTWAYSVFCEGRLQPTRGFGLFARLGYTVAPRVDFRGGPVQESLYYPGGYDTRTMEVSDMTVGGSYPFFNVGLFLAPF